MRPATSALLFLALALAAEHAERVAAQSEPAAIPRIIMLPPTAGDTAPASPDLVSTKPVVEIGTAVAEAAPDSSVPPRVPEMFGDQAPIGSLRHLPNGQILGTGVIYVPSVRYFKISDNGSPRPQTTDTFSFNYFYNLFGDVNARAGGQIQSTRIHREVFGMEWADSDQSMSFGLRLPLNTYNAQNTVTGLDGTGTDLGDLTAFWKFRLCRDDATGSLLSAGLAVTAPTATGSFAGTPLLKVFHNTCLQPFCGWIWRDDRLYLQGFSAVDAPTDLNDVVMLQNSVAAGYFLYQQQAAWGITAVVPTIEVHVNTPLNHRGVVALTDPAGNPDQLNLTAGINLEYGDASSVGVAFVRPLAGPRMFDFQVVFQARCRY
jgi:hypothetical protein